MNRCVQAIGGLILIVTFLASVVAFLLLCGAIVNGAEVEKPKPPCPVLASLHDPVLDMFAQAHAQRQAACCCQGHQGFERRAAKLLAVLPGRRVAEICAESWRHQANCTEAELWAEAVRCWRQSPGHWSVADRRHWRIGCGLAKGENQIWYLTVIAVD